MYIKKEVNIDQFSISSPMTYNLKVVKNSSLTREIRAFEHKNFIFN